MRIETQQSGTVTIVAVHAPRIDSGVCHAFLEGATPACAGKRLVVLDLSRVSLVDSSGLGAVVALRKVLGAEASMAVAGAPPSVATLFRLTRLDKVFPLYPSVLAATEALAPS